MDADLIVALTLGAKVARSRALGGARTRPITAGRDILSRPQQRGRTRCKRGAAATRDPSATTFPLTRPGGAPSAGQGCRPSSRTRSPYRCRSLPAGVGPGRRRARRCRGRRSAVSSPGPPEQASLPLTPSILSAPLPPQMMSFPTSLNPPWMVSCRPARRSRPGRSAADLSGPGCRRALRPGHRTAARTVIEPSRRWRGPVLPSRCR